MRLRTIVFVYVALALAAPAWHWLGLWAAAVLYLAAAAPLAAHVLFKLIEDLVADLERENRRRE